MTPEELAREIVKFVDSGLNNDKSKLNFVELKLRNAIAAAVSAEHQRTLEQAAKVAALHGLEWAKRNSRSDAISACNHLADEFRKLV